MALRPAPSRPGHVPSTSRFGSPATTATIALTLVLGALALAWSAFRTDRDAAARMRTGVERAQHGVAEWSREALERTVRLTAYGSGSAPDDDTFANELVARVRRGAGEPAPRAIAVFSPQGAMVTTDNARLLADPMLGQRLPAIQRARAGSAAIAGPVWATTAGDAAVSADWLIVTAAPVRDATGRAVAVLALFHDPTAPVATIRASLRPDLRADAYLSATGVPQDDGSVRSASGIATPLDATVHFVLAGEALPTAIPLPAGIALAGGLLLAALLVVRQRRVGMTSRATGRNDEADAILRSAPNPVLVLDDRGAVIRVSPAAEQMLDTPADDLIGSSVERWLASDAPLNGQGVAYWLESAKRAGTARPSDGSARPVELRIGSSDLEGRPLHVVVMLDRADRQAASRALAEAKRASQAERQRQAEYIAHVSHEIRTPMSRVMGMAHLLKDTSLSPVQQGYVESLMRSAQTMMTFVTDVLDLSKMESGTLQLIEASFELRTAVGEVVALAAAQAEASETTIDAKVTDRTPVWVVGDTARFRQVLINLVGNAIKFTPGGLVELRVEGTQVGTEVRVKVQVRDNGPGMDVETERRLLAKDPTTVSKLAAGGLGISMAKHLVELMGGRLEIQTLQGEGTTFSFNVVFRAVDSAATTAPASLAGARAIVVDRAADEQRSAREQLKSWGMRVEGTASMEDAFSRLRKAAAEGDPIEIALVDRQTLGEQGDAFARRLRSDPAIAGTGLLVAGASDDPREREILAAAGYDGALTGQITPSSLSRTMAAVVQRPRATRGRGPLLGQESGPAGAAAEARPEGTIQVVEPPSARRAPSLTPGLDDRLRVLLAEDNRVNQIIATNLLQRLGCRVDVVSDGEEAVRLASRTEFAVILMDIQMPKLDGLGATMMIRRLPAPFGGAHIIAMGTSASPDEHDRYLAAGMQDVVVKPLTPEAVQAVLSRRPAGVPVEA